MVSSSKGAKPRVLAAVNPAPRCLLCRSHKIEGMRLSRLKRLPSRAKRAARYEIHAHWRRQPIVQGSVFYESFSGNGMLDNPEAIFRAILDAPDLGRLTHIWALSDLNRSRAAGRDFAGDPRVSFVRSGSAAYYRALATSQYLV